jgi:hypothetical protein
MAKTRADLINRVGLELRIQAAGEALEAHDFAHIGDTYDTELQSLEIKGFATWPDNQIPENVFMPMVRYMAATLAFSYGRDYVGNPRQMRTDLIEQVGKPYGGQTAEIEYF